MTLQIISNIVMLACVVTLFVVNRKLSKALREANEISESWRKTAYEISKQADSLRQQINEERVKAGENMIELAHWKQQAATYQPFAQYKIIECEGGDVDVVRLVQLYGSDPTDHQDYYTTIKRFTDKDASFNLSEAEELVEMLNEK